MNGDPYALTPKSIEAKVVIIGNQSVGKTSISRRLLDNTFSPQSGATVGASLVVKRTVVENCAIKLQVWDTAGGEKFRSMAPLFFRGACAAILVYDITNRTSFDDLDSWLKSLRSVVDENDCDILFVVGNKTDLSAKRCIYVNDINAKVNYFRENGYCDVKYMEVSALNSNGIDNLFKLLSHALYRKFTAPKSPVLGFSSKEKNLSLEGDLKSNSQSCCSL